VPNRVTSLSTACAPTPSPSTAFTLTDVVTTFDANGDVTVSADLDMSIAAGQIPNVPAFTVSLSSAGGRVSEDGESAFRSSVNSGIAQLNTACIGGRSAISSGTLEISNVDLAAEFTNLVVARRGFQANSRAVTASDELLANIVNLKR
jgi:flagellar hook protein FlgE